MKSHGIVVPLVLALAGAPPTLPAPTPAGAAAARTEDPAATLRGERAAIEEVVADYVGLYAAPTLERWKVLFHPALSVASPQDDGSIKVRGLEEFFSAHKRYFATGRRIAERLKNVRIDEGRRIARVTADFVLTDEEKEGRGRLGLHLAQGEQGWKVVAIIFSYDQAS